jgi:hypothetical protein
MVCYARPASRFAVLLIGALLVFGRPVSHFLDTAAFLVGATVATGGAAIAVAMVFAAFMSTRRRRAASGGCVNCQFRCQHAMTGPSGRLWLVARADRSGHARHAQPGPAPARHAPPSGRPAPVLLPMPSVRSAGLAGAAPRWPDRPLHHTPGQPIHRRHRQLERVGSSV